MFGETFLVRHDGREHALLDVLEARVQEVDGSLRLSSEQSLSALYDRYLREPRFYMLLLGALGLLALTSPPSASSASSATSSRAGPASSGSAWRLVRAGRRSSRCSAGRRCCWSPWASAAASPARSGSRATSRICSLVSSPPDPIALVAVAALLTTIAIAATLFPMRRALRVDPATTLRSE